MVRVLASKWGEIYRVAIDVGIFILLCFAAYGTYQINEARQDSKQALIEVRQQAEETKLQAKNNSATLCAFKNDLERRVSATEQFLKDNPEGFPGVPAGSIRVSLVNMRATLESFKKLKCPPILE